MKNYVVGFLFKPDRSKVLLIEKNRPKFWADRLLNGVGGEVLPVETPLGAMVREFREETGARSMGWVRFATRMHGMHTCIDFYKSFAEPATEPESATAEPVLWVRVANLDKHDLVPDLRWLIPLALDDNITVMASTETP